MAAFVSVRLPLITHFHSPPGAIPMRFKSPSAHLGTRCGTPWSTLHQLSRPMLISVPAVQVRTGAFTSVFVQLDLSGVRSNPTRHFGRSVGATCASASSGPNGHTGTTSPTASTSTRTPPRQTPRHTDPDLPSDRQPRPLIRQQTTRHGGTRAVRGHRPRRGRRRRSQGLD